MERFWPSVQALAGQTLRTLKQDKPFDITGVTADAIHMLIGPDRRYASISREQFAIAERYRLIRADVSRAEIDAAGIAKGRTAYAVAIIHVALY